MKSKFRYTAYVLCLGTVLFICILIALFFKNVLNPIMPLAFFVIICLFFLFVWIKIFYGELKIKAISVNIEHRNFIIKHYLGLGLAKTYDLDEISGFKISELSSKGGSYEYLYLMAGDKRIAKLSEFYHSNYKELKRYIVSMNIKNIGFERFSNGQEFKDIFS